MEDRTQALVERATLNAEILRLKNEFEKSVNGLMKEVLSGKVTQKEMIQFAKAINMYHDTLRLHSIVVAEIDEYLSLLPEVKFKNN